MRQPSISIDGDAHGDGVEPARAPSFDDGGSLGGSSGAQPMIDGDDGERAAAGAASASTSAVESGPPDEATTQRPLGMRASARATASVSASMPEGYDALGAVRRLATL